MEWSEVDQEVAGSAADDARAKRARRSTQPSNKEGLEDPTLETPLNDHNLLRKMLEDVEPGWEGNVLAGNCEYAEGEGDPDKINAANRLYALWERQGTESRGDLSCDTEHAESEGETEKTHAGRTMLGAGIDPCWERTACRLVALLEETQEEQERQGTASGQDAPLDGLQPGRMSHGSSDEELVCDHCRREIRWDQDSHPCPVQRCRYILHRNCVRPHMQEHHHSSPIPPEFASPFPMKLKPMRGAVVDGETQTVIGGRPELSDVATQTVIGLIPTPQLFNIDARDAPKYISRREAELFRKRRRVEAT